MEKQCSNEAKWRYTWPGRNELTCCDQHKEQILMVANALGFHLQMQPVIENGKCCESLVKYKEGGNE